MSFLKKHFFTDCFKRLFDYSLATFLIIVLCPVFLLVTVLQYFFFGKPLLFKQVRPGKNAKPFAIMKFRTMSLERDAQGNLLPDAKRLTKWGRFLRASSLDELPQLINILRGEMSFIGPRPLLMSFLEHYSETQMRRHEVLPGITGWAQVNGRNNLSWEKRFELDVEYVDNRSVLFDIKILILTAIKLFKREGIEYTSPMFDGSSNNISK